MTQQVDYFSVAVQFIVGAVSLGFGAYFFTNECSTGFLDIGRWTLGQGIAMLLISIGAIVTRYCGESQLYNGLYSWYGLFQIIWTIIGGVMVWAKSKDCSDESPIIYTVTEAVVIISIILLLIGGIDFIKNKRSNDNPV